MMSCEASIVVPTTGNCGELLRYSVASIRNQTVRDLEILIVGDGVTDEAREVIAELRREDCRICFHDFPKHERRGEPYRHQVIQRSRGKNIFYLCDRDLMLPNHVEIMTGFLRKYNFVSTTGIDVKRDQSLNIRQYVGYLGPGSTVEVSKRVVGCLSCVGHTRDMYNHLELGWRTTPVNEFTDIYMWKQFIAHPECKTFSSVRPTILYFKRGHYPGDPVDERAKELAFWSKILSTPDGIDEIFWNALAGLLMERRSLRNFRTQWSCKRNVWSAAMNPHKHPIGAALAA